METIAHGAHQHYTIQVASGEIRVALIWNKTGRVAQRWSYQAFGSLVRTVGKAPWIPTMSALDKRLTELKHELINLKEPSNA